MNTKRLNKEISHIQKTGSQVFDLINVDDPLLWRIVFYGPPSTPYEGGKFHITIEFSEQYPFKPPKLHFNTRIYHVMVRKDENLERWNLCSHCIFGSDWSPASTVKGVLETRLLLLFTDPEWCLDNCLRPELRDLYIKDRELYLETAKNETMKYAQD